MRSRPRRAAAIASPALSNAQSSSTFQRVGGMRTISGRATAARGAIQSPSMASAVATRGVAPGGSSATKKRASKRRASISGVIQRAQGMRSAGLISMPTSSRTSRAAAASKVSPGSTRPPGKTCAPAMKAMPRARRTR